MCRTAHSGLVTLSFRSLNLFMRPFVQMPRGFYHLATSACAVIPPRKNAKLWKHDTPGARARNEAVRASKYLGSALWRQVTGYHRRSRVETKMHCVKLLGQRLSARDFDRQVAEIQIRAAILNGFTALGIPKTEAVG
jgi:hypothetical protein